MAPRITADRDASAAGKKKAKANAEKAFKGQAASDVAEGKKAGETLKTVVSELKLPERRDFEHHIKTVRGFKAKVDEANGRYRNAIKAAEEAGIEASVIKALFKWENRDPNEARLFFAKLNRAFETANFDLQIQLFDQSGLSPSEKALQDGHRAGVAGESYDKNPHDLNSDIGRKWEEGRMRGQAELVGKMPEKEKAWPNDPDAESLREPAELTH